MRIVDNKNVKGSLISIPEGWTQKKLSDLADIKHGFPFKSEFWSNEETSRILVTPVNFKMGGGFSNSKTNFYSEIGPCPDGYLLQPEDLIVTMTDLRKDGGTLGFPAIIPYQKDKLFLHNQRIGKVDVLDHNVVYKKFLFYILCSDSYRRRILSTASGTTVNHTSPGRILEYECLLPPILEQKKIAEILYTVDDQIEQTNALVEKTKELKKGLMQQLLAKGIGHTNFKQTELGVIPEVWQVKSLQEIADTMSGGTPNRGKKDFFEQGLIPWIKTGELGKKDLVTTEEMITEEAIQNSSAKIIPVDSVIVAMYGATIGKSTINKIPAATNQACCALIPHSKVINYEFLYYSICNHEQDLVKLGAGAAQPNISQNIIRNFRIRIPELSEQERIAGILASVDKLIDEKHSENERLRELKKGLMQKLLTGQIRVKVS